MGVDGGMNDDASIANAFTDLFAQACNPNTEATWNLKTQQFMKDKKFPKQIPAVTMVSVELIGVFIDKLKTGQSSSLGELIIEHLKYAHPGIAVIVAKRLEV